MKIKLIMTLTVSVFLVFQRAFHRAECHRARNMINKFLWKRRPLLLQFYVSVILNDFNKTFFYGFLSKKSDVKFSHGTFATVFGSVGKKTIQTPSFHYFWDLYISEIEKTNSTETNFRF